MRAACLHVARLALNAGWVIPWQQLFLLVLRSAEITNVVSVACKVFETVPCGLFSLASLRLTIATCSATPGRSTRYASVSTLHNMYA